MDHGSDWEAASGSWCPKQGKPLILQGSRIKWWWLGLQTVLELKTGRHKGVSECLKRMGTFVSFRTNHLPKSVRAPQARIFSPCVWEMSVQPSAPVWGSGEQTVKLADPGTCLENTVPVCFWEWCSYLLLSTPKPLNLLSHTAELGSFTLTISYTGFHGKQKVACTISPETTKVPLVQQSYSPLMNDARKKKY